MMSNEVSGADKSLSPMPPYHMEQFSSGNVQFQPWIGEQYSTGGALGVRVLLLGESHYTGEHFHKSKEITANYTRHIMQLWAVQENSIFYSKVRNLVLRALHLPVNCYSKANRRQAFWDSVAFYNYVPEFVAKKPKSGRASFNWLQGKDGFWEVLERLKPEVCVVLGEELWGHLPTSLQEEGRSISRLADRQYDFRCYRIGDHDTLFAHTPHPSSYGNFKIKEVVPRIRRLFQITTTKGLCRGRCSLDITEHA